MLICVCVFFNGTAPTEMYTLTHSVPTRRSADLNDQSHRGALTDPDRWLDAEIARRELVAGARDILLGRYSDGLHKIALAGNRQFRPDAEQCCERHTLQQRPGVTIDLVG